MNSENKPNILFIMDDQHRFDYLGCMGADFVSTPHLDRLAAQGMLFSRCFTNSPLCAPARISLASGLLPSRMGTLDNKSYLPQQVTTFYQRLRDAGYRVGCVGKLDLAKPDHQTGRYGDRPCTYQWGFTHPEEYEGKMKAAGRNAAPRSPYTRYLHERGLLQQFHEDYHRREADGTYDFHLFHDSVLPADAYGDAYIGRRAAEWIEWVPDEFPWFYFVSFGGPHDPFDPPTEYADRYRHASMPPAIADELEGKPERIKRRQIAIDPQTVAVTRRQYCATIELIDRQIGLILEALERRGMIDNTYIIFTSDHGEMLGDHGLYQKTVAYEPSLRVPLLIAGPVIEGGQVSDALVELGDLNPTVCDMAGLSAQPHIDAQSIFPLFNRPAAPHRTEIVSVLQHFRCVRTDRYKMIENFNDRDELYDMENDPSELHNIAEKKPEIVRDLKRRLSRRFQANVTYRG